MSDPLSPANGTATITEKTKFRTNVASVVAYSICLLGVGAGYWRIESGFSRFETFSRDLKEAQHETRAEVQNIREALIFKGILQPGQASGNAATEAVIKRVTRALPTASP